MKAEESHKMTDEEIVVETNRQRRHLYDLKSQAATEKLENSSQLRKVRRDIARLLTEQRARQLAAAAEAKV